MMNINRMMPFCNLFMERSSYYLKISVTVDDDDNADNAVDGDVTGCMPWSNLTASEVQKRRLECCSPSVDAEVVENESLCDLVTAGLSHDAECRPKDAESFKHLLLDACPFPVFVQL